MKSNELRIGILVYDVEDGNYYEIESIYLNYSNVYWVSYRDGSINCSVDALEPIVLTEEWLLKFGFEKFVEHTPSFGHDDIYRKSYIDINGRYNQYHFRNILIESVHELQNLYFALTKEELTMK